MKLRALSILFLALSIGSGSAVLAQSYRNVDTLLPQSGGKLLIGAYASLGAGSTFIPGSALPTVASAGGLRLSPWFSLGMFVDGTALSNFEHASLGLSAADRQNSYMVCSGTELLFTPWASAVVHPLFSIRLGGASVGYMVDTDGEEGFEGVKEQRYFLASASAGCEVNLSRFFLLNARIGGRFVGNSRTLGIGAGDLSGLEASVGFRLIYGILVE